MIKMVNFITEHGLTLTCKPTDKNPNMEGHAASLNHWACTLRATGRRPMRFVFSMGAALKGEPQLPDVLDCLASDALVIENARDLGFESWADEYGYNTDSRKAERTYKICVRQAERLKTALGHGYQPLLFDVERG